MNQDWCKTVNSQPPATSSQQPAAGLRITFPDDGDIFKIDPVLRLEFQTLWLECVVEGKYDRVTWLIDGKPLPTVGPPFHTRWQMAKGEHMLQLQADEMNKTPAASATVRFSVF